MEGRFEVSCLVKWWVFAAHHSTHSTHKCSFHPCLHDDPWHSGAAIGLAVAYPLYRLAIAVSAPRNLIPLTLCCSWTYWSQNVTRILLESD